MQIYYKLVKNYETIKKLLSFATAAALSAVALSGSLAASAASTSYNTYRVYYDVASGSGVQNYQSVVSFSKSSLNHIGYHIGNRGGTLSTFGSGGSTHISTVGTINFPSNITGAGTLFTLSFYGSKAAPILNGTDASLSTSIAKNSSGATITPNPVTVSEVLVGDINQDGIVDTIDGLTLSRFLNGKEIVSGQALRAADTNGDFMVNEDDLDLMLEYFIGSISHFPK